MHSTMLAQLTAIAVFLTAATAAPASRVEGAAVGQKREVLGYGYGTFYNSNDCTSQGADSETEAISVDTGACIPNSAAGYNSIYVQPGAKTSFTGWKVLWFSDAACTDQIFVRHESWDIGKDFCDDFQADDAPAAQAFKLVLN